MEEREYVYTAVDYLSCHHRKFGMGHMNRVVDLMQEKAWWDSVDAMTSGVISKILKRETKNGRVGEVQKYMDEAVQHKNMWVRRMAMIHQLGWREMTDVDRLLRYAGLLAPEKEFFIQKAIGWALRDYARHDAEVVRKFLKKEKTTLSSLSVREASKHL
jgi:3-methyladenine DNA glycosylase AlkD